MRFSSVPARERPALLWLCAAIALTLLAAPQRAHAQEDNYRYGNLVDVSGSLSYMNTDVGSKITRRAQLPGVDVSATEWLVPRWGAMADLRGYVGLGDALPNPYGVNSPLVTDTQFVAGPQYRWIRTPSIGVDFHALAGGAYGAFDGHIPTGVSGPDVGLYPNGGTFAVVIGPDLDFHRNTGYSIRISPGYTVTHFGGELQSNFSLSAGLVFHFGHF